jgi:carotenoid cleavage dioxygenase
MTKPDASNTANTSVVFHHGELMALWEGGSATRVDPDSLDTLGFKTWRKDYAGMPFSAHPKVEADGTLWNFGVSGFAGLLCIYRISASGELLAAHTIKVENTVMIHDFAVTEKHLVFLLPPLVFDIDRVKSGLTLADSYVWRPELGMRVLVVDKNDLDRVQWFELPSAFVFHVGNAWEADGKIHLDYVAAPSAWWVLSGAKKLMRGEYEYAEGQRHFPRLAIAEFNLKSGSATHSYTDLHAEFPTLNQRLVGKRHRKLYTTARLGDADRPGFDAIASFDRDSGKTTQFRYGDEYLVEEHLFVPRPGSAREDDGWFLGTAMDLKRQAMVLSVFEASRLADGPIAQATMDRIVPIGFHGTYVKA